MSGERGGGWWGGLGARRVLVIAALFIVGYFSLSIVSNAITQNRLSARETALQQEVQVLERREARLQALRTYMQSDAFVEAAARQNAFLRPGEIAVVPVGPAATTDEAALAPGDPWWFRYLHAADRR